MKQNPLLFSLPLLVAAALLTPRPVSAQFGGPSTASVRAAVQPAAMTRGGHGILRVTLTVKPSYHVNANKPNDPAYIPTEFSVQPARGIAFGAVRYPAAQLVKVSYSAKPLLVYRGQVTVLVPFTVTPAARPGSVLIAGSISYQACDAKSCFPPTSAPVKAAVTVK